MATLLSCATGNWLAAGTWALVDSTSFTGTSSEGSSTNLTTSYVSSTTFTPGAITIDAIAVRLGSRLGTTGTMSVALDQATTTVTGTEVIINVADLPSGLISVLDGGWIAFKFAAPVLLVAATAYSVKMKTSTGSMVLMHSVATTNWARMLRTTTTQAPVAGDDVHVAGEFTGAGTSNTLTVTMNETAATDYGSAPTAANSLITPGVGISSKGVLTFKDTSAANPYLRLSNSLIVYNGGILNIGTTGTPIPRDSRAILEFDCAADGDYGLIVRNGGTWNGQGLSRTSGKLVVSCKLAADTTGTNLLSGAVVAGSAASVTPFAALDPTAISRFAATVADTAANSAHMFSWSGSSVSNTTQVFSVWLARGSGTNNRYCRVQLGNSLSAAPTNGFYVDADLQAGTAGTCTAVGNGTATSAAIAAVGSGFVVTIIGKVSSGAATSTAVVLCSSASGTVTYLGDATQCLIYYGQQLFTTGSLPSADLTVDTDTGWLAGDMIATASTTRTAGDCEASLLTSNAGASTLTPTEVITNNHSGTSPTQAEVILLTRNVVVRGVTSLLMAYVNPQAGSIVDLDWVEFYWLGENAVNKRGFEIGSSGTVAVNVTMHYCSIHDVEDGGLFLFTTSGAILITTCVVAYTMMWNLATTIATAVLINGAVTPTNWTFDHNILIRNGTGTGISLSDVGGTFTNNTVVGAFTSGFGVGEANLIGTFSGNVAHSCTTIGLAFTAGTYGSVVDTFTAWRNASSGMSFSTNTELVFTSAVLFGNASQNILMSSGCQVSFKAPVMSGDTTFSTGAGINITTSSPVALLIEDGDFGTVTGIKAAHTTADMTSSGTNVELQGILRNTKLASTETSFTVALSSRSYVSSQKHDQTAGNHITWMKYGKVQTDTAIYKTASPSLRMTPSALTSVVVHPVTTPNAVTVTSSSATISTVPAHVFDWFAVGDWVVASAGFTSGARITAMNSGAGTITVDRTSTSSTTSANLTFYKGRLATSPPGRGWMIAVPSAGTKTVGVWVKKQSENLFTYSEDYSNGVWAVSAATLTGSQTDWDGGSTASKFLETTANSAQHGLLRNTSLTVVSGLTYTLSFYAKGIDRQWLRVNDNGRFTWIDLTNGVAGTVNAAHTVNSVTSAGSSWYRVSITMVVNATTFPIEFYSTTADNNSSAFVGDVAKGFLLGGLQVEWGSTAAAYQITTSSIINGYIGYYQPRLIQRANPALGIAADVVLDTMALGNGVWEQLSGATTAPSGDDGVIELYVDCDMTAVGWVNVDDFSVT